MTWRIKTQKHHNGCINDVALLQCYRIMRYSVLENVRIISLTSKWKTCLFNLSLIEMFLNDFKCFFILKKNSENTFTLC